MLKRNLTIQISNCTPEPPTNKPRSQDSPDEGCYVELRGGSPTFAVFDNDVDSMLCLQEKGDEGYSSLSYEAQDVVKESQEKAIEEEMKIGPPLFESSICGDVEESSFNSTWETTPPLQVKVKSVVVPLEGALTQQREREQEQKKQYVNAVTRHMQEYLSQDPMGELLTLMTKVSQDTHGPQWQHPSDLTRRNYKNKFSTSTRMSLQEWEKKNSQLGKRFSNVPKIFKRSSFL